MHPLLIFGVCVASAGLCMGLAARPPRSTWLGVLFLIPLLLGGISTGHLSVVLLGAWVTDAVSIPVLRPDIQARILLGAAFVAGATAFIFITTSGINAVARLCGQADSRTK